MSQNNQNNNDNPGNSVVPIETDPNKQNNKNIQEQQRQIRPVPPSPVQPQRPNQNRQINSNNLNNNSKPRSSEFSKNASMSSDSGLQHGYTRTFDTKKDIGINTKKEPPHQYKSAEKIIEEDNTNENPGDGTYNYTGRNIKSNRQRFADASSDGFAVSENKKKQRDKDDDIDVQKGGIISGILKVILYIAAVLIISGVLSYNIILIANDVFAFVKEPVEAGVTIPENADIHDISQILYEKDVIKYPKIFNLYIGFRQKDKSWEFQAGDYLVTSDMNYDELIWKFRKKAAAREVIRVTVPEGYTIDQIIDLFLSYGIGTRETFVKLINEFDFSELGYKFLNQLYENKNKLSSERKYILEGYLFPDTYDFYKDENEYNILTKFLANFNSKFTEEYYQKCEILNMTIDEVVTLASIVEREGKYKDDLEGISAVFHNRLSNKSNYPYLQSDATIMYSYGYNKSDLTEADLKEDWAYNTYTRQGLPPSAICNPGYESLSAALWPEENSPHYYFISDLSGWAQFSSTLAEHEQKREQIRRDRESAAITAAAMSAATEY